MGAKKWIIAVMGGMWLMAGCATPSYIDPKDPLLTGYRPHSLDALRHTAVDMQGAAPHKESFEEFVVAKGGNNQDEQSYRDLLRRDHERKLKIAAMESLLPSAEKNKKLELYLQLADAHRERHDFLYQQAINRYLLALDGKIATPDGAQPVLHQDEAGAELLQSADCLRNIEREFPNHEKSREVLLALARTLGRVGNENATYYYNTYQKHKPTDVAQAEIWTAQGEEAFDRGDLKAAIEFYKKAITLKTAPTYPYAVYKLGWAYILTGIRKPSEALSMKTKAHAAFALVVKLTEKKDAVGLWGLHGEVLYDQCLWWAETGDMDAVAVDNYLRDQQRSDLYPIYLVHRARSLLAQKKYEQAIDLYSKLLSTQKPVKEWVDYYAALVDLYHAAGMDNNVYQAITAWRDNLNAAQGPWADMFALAPESKKKSQSLFTAALAAYAAQYLDKAQKEGGATYLTLAEKFYRLKIELAPLDEKRADTHFNMGLIQFQKGDLDAAQKEFQTAFDLAGASDKMRVDSAYNRLITLVRIEEKAREAGAKDEDACQKSVTPAAAGGKDAKKSGPAGGGLIERKKQLISALDRYIALVGEDKRKEMLPLMFDCAMAMMTCGPKAEALGRLEVILLASPSSPQGKSAFSAIFSYLIDQNSWAEVANRCEKYLGDTKLKGKGFDALLKGLLAQANEKKT